MEFAQGGGGGVDVVWVRTTTRKADLTLVGAHRLGALGEEHGRETACMAQRDYHRRASKVAANQTPRQPPQPGFDGAQERVVKRRWQGDGH
jgi:hypothetical protein